MKLKLRLSIADLDLIALRQNPSFPFSHALKESLKVFSETGVCTTIAVPPLENVVIQKETVDIYLHEIHDKSVIDWLKKLQKGLRSSAIKAVFRSSLDRPPVEVFYDGKSEMADRPVHTGRGIPQKASKKQVPTECSHPVISQPAEKPAQNRQETQMPDDFDLFENEFFDNF